MKRLIFFLGVLLSPALLNGQSIVWLNYSHPQQRATYDASFSGDGTKVLTGSECHEAHVRIFDAVNGTMIWDYQLDTTLFCVQGVKFSAGGTQFVAAEETGNLLLFDYTGPSPVITDTIVTGNAAALSVDFDSSGNTLLIGGYNNYRTYDIASKLFTSNINAHTGLIWAASFSHSQQWILTGASDDKAKIHNLSGGIVRTFNGHTSDVMTAKFTSNDSIVVTGSRDDKIKVWNANTGAVIRTITGHTGDVMRIDISPDDRFIASASADATIRIWDLQTGIQLASIPDTSGTIVYCVQWSADGTKLLAGNGATQVILYDVSAITATNDVQPDRVVLSYPNPVRSGGSVRFSEGVEKIVQYSLYDAHGRLVHQLENRNGITQLQLPALPAGNYSYQLRFKDDVVVPGKLIVN